MLEYWQSRRGDRELPARRDIDPSELVPILPFVLLVNVSHSPVDFDYRLIGTGIVDRSVRDYTGVRLMELPGQRKPSAIWDLYETSVVERRPIQMRVPYLRIDGKFVEMQSLPLAADGETVDMLIGSVTFEHDYLNPDDPPAI